MADPIPPEILLADYPPEIQAIAERLREIVREAVPDAIERVRPGWRLIGYDVPVGRRTRYFACVWPEREHAHLGFAVGFWMPDPDGILEGAHLDLKRVRFVTFRPGEPIPAAVLARYVRAAADLAALGIRPPAPSPGSPAGTAGPTRPTPARRPRPPGASGPGR
ncbi:MAG TPA: DUF1801 domain-containing protein [candidate division Zixibacteria bacterium]|nr:DUF1801 domain-containing protein [candidate division Zixibacteria bacterium]